MVAGEISTGKSSVLEFIDYCLGAGEHPSHPEIQRKVRAALLEVELGDSVTVIERPVFTTSSVATVHQCSLDGLSDPHTTIRKVLRPAGDPESLSTLLLDYCGLRGVVLKEAPTKAASETDPLSFRDVMWLAFLPNRRLDNENLLHENTLMQALKMRQVIEVVFDVHDNALAELGDRLTSLSKEQERLQAEVESVRRFLN